MVRLPIRFINLDRAVERRRFMEEQGERLGLALERVRALEPGNIDSKEYARLARSWERPLSGGEIGCFLSHRAEWQRVLQTNAPALILEDDAVLSPKLAEVLAASERLEIAEMLNLEDLGKRRFLDRGKGLPLAAGVHAVRCRRDKAGTAGYLLWPAGAAHLLRATAGRAGPADAMLHGAGLQAYVCEPPVVVQIEVLERRGLRTAINGRSFIQAPRPAGPGWLGYPLRRLRTQARLVPHHLSRLGRTSYRRVRFDEADFT